MLLAYLSAVGFAAHLAATAGLLEHWFVNGPRSTAATWRALVRGCGDRPGHGRGG